MCVFVHGCFWHGCSRCNRPLVPKSNTQYWVDKVARNKARDAENEQALRARGFEVLVVWECSMRQDIDSAVSLVQRMLDARRGI